MSYLFICLSLRMCGILAKHLTFCFITIMFWTNYQWLCEQPFGVSEKLVEIQTRINLRQCNCMVKSGLSIWSMKPSGSRWKASSLVYPIVSEWWRIRSTWNISYISGHWRISDVWWIQLKEQHCAIDHAVTREVWNDRQKFFCLGDLSLIGKKNVYSLKFCN